MKANNFIIYLKKITIYILKICARKPQMREQYLTVTRIRVDTRRVFTKVFAVNPLRIPRATQLAVLFNQIYFYIVQ